MTKKQNILFLVGTEYHMLVCLSAVADRYSDPEKYQVTIWQKEDSQKRRFLCARQISYPNVIYKVVTVDGKYSDISDSVRRLVRLVERQNFDQYIFFNDVDLLSIYLARRLKLQGTHIILAPDGMKAYGNVNRLAPRWCLQFALRYYKFLKANRLRDAPGIYYPSMKYAYLKQIDEVWVPFFEPYNNWNSKKVVEVKVMETPASIALLDEFYGFDANVEIPVNDRVIFMIGMPPVYPLFEQINLTIVVQLRERFPDYPMLFKLHPSSSAKQIADLEKVEGITLIRRPFPAEIYVAQLKNSIVLSYWSTSSLINNPSCRFYWLYKIVKKETTKIDYMKLVNPTRHIVEVDEIEQIQ